MIERDLIKFRIGGGAHKGKTCLNLWVDDKIVLSATGQNNNRMEPRSFAVRRWAGRTAKLQVVDDEKGSWGNIGLDYIVFSDEPLTPQAPLNEQPDFGTMGLALLKAKIPTGVSGPDITRAALPEADPAAHVVFDGAAASGAAVARPFGAKLVGSLMRKLALGPGESATVSFVVTWHFPNLKIDGLGDHRGRWYGTRFSSAVAVADYVAQNYDRLRAETVRWHDTWYDSTLPYWFLDRTFLNASILATNTCYWLGNGRFYGWEGVGLLRRHLHACLALCTRRGPALSTARAVRARAGGFRRGL